MRTKILNMYVYSWYYFLFILYGWHFLGLVGVMCAAAIALAQINTKSTTRLVSSNGKG